MSRIQAIAQTSLVNETLGKLVEAIASGEFIPGQKLSEASLARQLGISRGPLREALQRLEGKVVMRTPRRGVRVIDFSRPVLEQIFYVREALEGMAARLAAENSSTGEIEALTELLSGHAVRPELEAGEAYLQRSDDEDFHLAIARAAKCERLQALLLDEVYFQLRLYRARSSMRPGRARAALEEHRSIVAALEAHDPSAAEREMRRHIRNARLSALAGLPTQ
ncbi:GntR family transcriptional regulator [Methylobacterium mesophilicum SR1.6/6]|uniref:GntR family transcriptional regulator n=1 Tax=Methylobacterium mesophilicum SR1.6/6 TaxID=908290 RepID=A0A6B9FY11_9HYPH|nr:GntR family transcriptional regulator [Methylobacterium mesophilicum SR1.6/6]